MMTRNPRDKGPSSTKQEPSCLPEEEKATATAAAARARANSRTWPGLKDPRVVRVSRAFGGKDRHSKVSTVRGLRDRRVRLSVQTAIQLYDLQDRLGLSQPSKVVDWLLDAAQLEIDKLPPLQIPPGSCFLPYPPLAAAAGSAGLIPPTWQSAASPMAASMEDSGAGSLALLPGRDHVEHQTPPLPCRDQHHGVEVIPVHGNLHRLGFLSMPSSNNSAGGAGAGGGNPYASYCFLETPGGLFAPPNLGGGFSITQQAAEESHSSYRPTSPPTPCLSLSHASQLLQYPAGGAAPTAPSMFSPYAASASANASTVFHLQMAASSGSSQNSKHHHQFWNGQESG